MQPTPGLDAAGRCLSIGSFQDSSHAVRVDRSRRVAKASGQGRNYLTEYDKKLRHVQNALQVLEEAELVRLPNRSATKEAYEDSYYWINGEAETLVTRSTTLCLKQVSRASMFRSA